MREQTRVTNTCGLSYWFTFEDMAVRKDDQRFAVFDDLPALLSNARSSDVLWWCSVHCRPSPISRCGCRILWASAYPPLATLRADQRIMR